MKIAYSYIRFSTSAQGEESRDSTRRQSASAKLWCERNGYTLSTQTFLDAGKSAHKGEHIAEDGELGRFIKLAKKGEIPSGAVLILDSVDRFTRLPTYRSLKLFMEVIDSGIGLVFAGSHILRDVITSDVLDKAGNEHLLQILIGEMQRAYAESAEKSRKIREALDARKAKMKKGEVMVSNGMPKYFSFNGKSYELNDKAEIVRDLAKGILSGKSLFEMAKDLNKRGVKTMRGFDTWSGNAISGILKSRTLLGEFRGVKDYLPALTDESTFNRVQNILNQNKSFGRGQKSEFPNIFKGVARCAHCGEVMVVNTQTTKGVTYRYLKCSGLTTTCENKRGLRLADAEIEFFAEYLFKEPAELVNDSEKEEVKTLRGQKVEQEANLAQISKQIEKLLDLDMEGPELKKRLTKLESERTKANSAIDSINNKLRGLVDSPALRDETRKVMLEIIDFNENKTQFVYLPEPERIRKALQDVALRDKLRLNLPSLVGKVTVDGLKGQFYVYNRAGKMVYESNVYESKLNNSEAYKRKKAA